MQVKSSVQLIQVQEVIPKKCIYCATDVVLLLSLSLQHRGQRERTIRGWLRDTMPIPGTRSRLQGRYLGPPGPTYGIWKGI